MYSSMQISNSSLSQFVSNTVNLNQQGSRPFARPVTIEGQIVDDEKTESANKQTVNSVLEDSESESQTQLIQAPIRQDPASGNFINPLLSQENSQQLLQNNPANTQTPSFVSQNDFSQKESLSISSNFPYANRKSFAGLAGSSLVIQTYLNHESPTQNQSAPVQGNINFYV